MSRIAFVLKRSLEIIIISLIVMLILSALIIQVSKRNIVNNISREHYSIFYQSPWMQEEAKKLNMTPRQYLEYYYLKKTGLNKPIYILVPQYLKQALEIVVKYRSNLSPYVTKTLALLVLSWVLILLLGIPLGLFSGLKRDSPLDHILTFMAPFSEGVPAWWLAGILILLLGFKIDLLPVSGWESLPPKEGIWRYFDILSHLIIPVLSVALVYVWGYAFRIRNLAIEEFDKEYVAVARAKGFTEWWIIRKHILRNVFPPFLTFTTYTLLDLITGTFIIDIIFGLKGLGTLLYYSFSRHVALNQGVIMSIHPMLFLIVSSLIVLIYVIAAVLLEALYVYLDPRVGVRK
ncbi:ABC transporter permease [Thermococcus sp.]